MKILVSMRQVSCWTYLSEENLFCHFEVKGAMCARVDEILAAGSIAG
jgi:hypothetical protein